MLRWKTAVVLLMSLWLPLQGMAAVIMPFCDGSQSINVPRHQMPAELITELQRPLQIDLRAGVQLAQVGARKRLRPGLELQQLPIEVHYGQTTAIQSDAIPQA